MISADIAQLFLRSIVHVLLLELLKKWGINNMKYFGDAGMAQW